LYEKNAASFEEVEKSQGQYEVDLGRMSEMRANLELVKAGAPPQEIASAEAILQRWREERDMQQNKIDRSILKMPFDGELVTLHLKQKIGHFLEDSKRFAVVENTSEVFIEIEVPESDVGFVNIPAPVKARTWAYHEQTIDAVATMIDATVIKKEFGNVVKVICQVDNADGRLKSGMSGQAKIEGVSMPVWKVFTRAIARFIRIELWSWVP
jgi:putative peptide zinc metalloprotease protein